MFKLYFAVILAAVFHLGCTVSPDHPKTPDLGALSPMPNDTNNSDGTARSAQTDTVKTTISYSEIANGRCLKAWNWESATSLVCSFQGFFQFYTIIDKNPQTFVLDLIGSDGTAYRFDTKKSTSDGNSTYKITMSHSGGTPLSFDGINFGSKNHFPQAGYVIYDGNSGVCAPVVSGTRQTCFKAIRSESSYGDSVGLEFFAFPKDTAITVENCSLKAIESFQSRARFSVMSEKCEIKGLSYKKDDNITFDLIKPANFPSLTTPSY